MGSIADSDFQGPWVDPKLGLLMWSVLRVNVLGFLLLHQFPSTVMCIGINKCVMCVRFTVASHPLQAVFLIWIHHHLDLDLLLKMMFIIELPKTF